MGNKLRKVRPLDNNVKYRRDSFSDRVCDDLSEVILQYLSLKDKLRLECVSKQFQRTVFQRNYDYLTISRKKFQKIKTSQKIL